MLSTNDVIEYGYLCLMRPPMPGAVPREGLLQCKGKEGHSRESGHHYWGLAFYDRELTPEEIRHYDLERASLELLD